MASILILSCSKNADIDEQGQEKKQTEQQPAYNFKTETLGAADSGYKIYNWCYGRLTSDDDADTNRYLKIYKAYLDEEMKYFDKIDSDTKNYLQPYLDDVRQASYDAKNLDKTIKTIYDGGTDIITDLINALPTKAERRKFCFILELIWNESYGRGGLGMTGNMDINYSSKISNMTDYLQACNIPQADAKEDIKNNNSTNLINEFNQVLAIAVENLNTKQHLSLTVESVKNLINLKGSARSLHNMRDFMPKYNTYGLIFTSEREMEQATILKQENTTSNSQNTIREL